jgi:hypothetical protein
MTTEKELNEEILAKTMQIRDTHPELVKFIDEMTVTLPDENKPKINIKILKEYYESLSEMLKEHV